MTSSIAKKTPKREKTEEHRRKPQERFLAPQPPLGMTAKGKSKKKNKDKDKDKDKDKERTGTAYRAVREKIRKT